MSTIPIDEFSLSLVSLSSDPYYPHDEIDDTFLQYSTSIHHVCTHRKSTSLTDAIGEDLSPLPPQVRPNFFSKIDLDITRISDRIIVISQCWRHRTEKKSFRNNVHEMAIFLETRYQDSYMIWNFSPHVDDLYVAFDSKLIQCQKQLSYIPYSLGSILEICSSMTAWLRLHPNHVVISHCHNGRQLSGMIISCLLRYCECFDSTRESMEYFIQRRSPSDASWFTQAMKRMLRYFQDALLLKGVYPNPLPLSLRQVILNSIPNFDGSGSCSPGLEIYMNDQLVYSSLLSSKCSDDVSFLSDDQDQLDPFSSLSNILNSNLNISKHKLKSSAIQSELFQDAYHIVFQFGKGDDCILPVLYGNVFIRLFHRNPITLKNVTMFTCSFHTGWMKTGLIRFRSRDLDLSSRDKQPLTLNRFSSDFSMDLILTNIESQPLFGSCTDPYISEHYNEQLKEEMSFQQGKHLEREFTILSQYHPTIPDASLLRPLELQGVPPIIARLSLQSRHNDLHLAHEFIHYFRTTIHYQELEHEQEEQQISLSESQIEHSSPPKKIESNHITEHQKNAPIQIKVGSEIFRKQLEEKLTDLKSDSTELPMSAPASKNTQSMERLLFLSPPSDIEKRLLGSPVHTTRNIPDHQNLPPPLVITTFNQESSDNGSASSNAPPPLPPPPLLDSLLSPVSPSRGKMIKNSLHWKAIYSVTEKNNSMFIWTILSKKKLKIKLDSNEFEILFCVDPSIERSKLNQSVIGHNIPENIGQSKIEPLLDFRRTNNIAIGLTKLGKKFTDESLFHAVISRTGELDFDDLTTLKPLLPTAEERDLFLLSKRTKTIIDSDNVSLNSFSGVGSSSVRVENFMLQMCTEPNLSWMVDVLIFELSYDNDSKQLMKQLNSFIRAFDALSNDQDIPILLSFALELGNMASFEYGRSRSRKKAVGFHMDSLDKFKDVKSVRIIEREEDIIERGYSISPEWTLLDYLVETLHRQMPRILELPDRLEPILEQSRQIESALLSNAIKDLQTGMVKLKTPPYKDTSHIKEFSNSILLWRDSKKQQMKDLLNLYQKFITDWEIVAKYFGEDPNEKQAEDLINTWDAFLKQMKSSTNKLESRKIK